MFVPTSSWAFFSGRFPRLKNPFVPRGSSCRGKRIGRARKGTTDDDSLLSAERLRQLRRKLIAIAAPKPNKIGIKSKGRGGYVRAARTRAKRFQREILIFNLVRYTAPL